MSSNEMRPATLEEKQSFLNNVSRGFTRGMYHDTSPEELPLYHNGHDFYLLTGRQAQAMQLSLEL